MRLAIFAACIWLWVSPALAQTPVPAVLGATYAVVADHDGRYADDYVLRDAGAVLEVRSAAYWTLDTITFPGAFVATAGAHSLTVSARNGAGEAVSPPLLIMVAPPPQEPPPVPTLGPCTYTSPVGVTSTKPIGDTSVQGFNTYDFAKLADVQKFATRLQQLFAWGFSTQITQLNKPKNQVYILATCVGVATVTTPPPTTPPGTHPANALQDSAGDWWWIGAESRVTRNGSTAVGGIATEIRLVSGSIVILSSQDSQWYRWTGTTWAPTTSPK